jgi:hypothetical protein
MQIHKVLQLLLNDIDKSTMQNSQGQWHIFLHNYICQKNMEYLKI